jgi:hypothetical protein
MTLLEGVFCIEGVKKHSIPSGSPALAGIAETNRRGHRRTALET